MVLSVAAPISYVYSEWAQVGIGFGNYVNARSYPAHVAAPSGARSQQPHHDEANCITKPTNATGAPTPSTATTCATTAYPCALRPRSQHMPRAQPECNHVQRTANVGNAQAAHFPRVVHAGHRTHVTQRQSDRRAAHTQQHERPACDPRWPCAGETINYAVMCFAAGVIPQKSRR